MIRTIKRSFRSFKPIRTRPMLERLEDRIVPSADDWIATSAGDWSNPSNWSDGVPTSSSDVLFGITGQANGNCTMSVPGGVTVNSLTMNAAYLNSTLTLNTSLTTSSMTMSAGSIAQPNGAGSSIACNGALNWSGGTIGSQTNGPSSLTINNPNSGSTIGGAGAAEILGDNLFNAAGFIEITGEGSNNLVMTNSANIVNEGSGTIKLDIGGIGITNASGSSGSLNNQDGTIYVEGASGTVQCIPIVNIEGNISVGDQSGDAVKLLINGSNPQNGVSFLNNGGTLDLYTEADLIAKAGFTQQSGLLDITGQAGQAAFLCYNPPTGGGNVVISGGSVSFSSSNQALVAGADFSMTGGSLNITNDATALTTNTIYSYLGNITVGGGVTVTVNTVNIPQQGMPDYDWVIFQIQNGSGTVSAGGANYNFEGYQWYKEKGNGTQTFLIESYHPGG